MRRAPRLSRLLLTLSISAHDRRFALADVEEEFERRQLEQGESAARRWFRWQARRSLMPGLRHWLGPRRYPNHPAPAGRARTGRRGPRKRQRPDLLGDFAYGFRVLRKSPVAVSIAVLSLALGIGAVTTAFTITNGLLLRPPSGLRAPETLVGIYTGQPAGNLHDATSFPDFRTLLERVRGLDDAAAYRFGMITMGKLDDPSGAERLTVEIVTGNYFEVLGIDPVLGRGFAAGETPIGSAERSVVIGHRLWHDRFGGDPGVLGQSVRLDGEPYTIVGVAPESLVSRFIPLKMDAWVPLGVPGGVYHATPSRLASRTDRDFLVLGRLAPGTSLEQLQAELTALATGLHDEYGEEWEDERGRPLTLTALSERDSRLTPESRLALGGIMTMLFVATGLVLMIACSNVASILLARASRRRHEMAVRLALGASRGRLVTMLLSESLLIALAAGSLGTAAAVMASRAVTVLDLPIGMPLTFDFALDHRVLLFAVLLSIVACILFGLAPALEGSSPSLTPSLKGDAGPGTRRRRPRLRNVLVVGQVAASLVLVVAAGLVFRGFQSATSGDLGFDPAGIVIMSKQLPEDRFGPEARAQHFRDLRARLAAQPGVESAQLTATVESSLLGVVSRAQLEVVGNEPTTDAPSPIPYNSVTPGYLEMLRIPLLRGRTFRESDGLGAPRVAVVSRAFVEHYWPGSDGVGRHFAATDPRAVESTMSTRQSFEVIGVVEDGKYYFSEEEGGLRTPFFWTSFYQNDLSRVIIHVRGQAGAEQMYPILRAEMAEDEPALIMPTSFASFISFPYDIMRAGAEYLGYGGAFSLALAAIGIYGIVSFAVAQRRRELAVRLAIGANVNQVFRLVVRDGMRLALYGMVVGLLLTAPVSLLLETQAYGVSPVDPIAVGGGCAILLAAAALASFMPARRVTLLDPMETLRTE